MTHYTTSSTGGRRRLRAAVDHLTGQLHDGHAATGPSGETPGSTVDW
ncbi:hypothetical protein [Nocardia sp. MW-W600-9]